MKKKIINISFCNDNIRRDGLKDLGCYLCNKKIETNEFYAIDIEITTMRGDDECYALHRECLDKGVNKLFVQGIL